MKLMVLIVEDEATLAKNIKRYLERHGIYAVVVDSGDEALGVVNERHPDVVLVDSSLHGMDGLTLSQRIRRIDDRAAVVMLSGESGTDAAARLAAAGASAWHGKPVAMGELKRTLMRFIRYEEYQVYGQA